MTKKPQKRTRLGEKYAWTRMNTNEGFAGRNTSLSTMALALLATTSAALAQVPRPNPRQLDFMDPELTQFMCASFIASLA